MRTVSMVLAIGFLTSISPVEAQCCRKGEGSQHGCQCGAMAATRAGQPAMPREKSRDASPATETSQAPKETSQAPKETSQPVKRDEATRPVAVAAAGPQRGRGRAGRGMASGDHENIHILLSQHRLITRIVEEIPGGVRTTTTTDRPELVATLRAHVRQMAQRLEEGRPIRMWDPVFREVFASADEITLKWKDIEGGIEVTETSADPDVVPLIRAHARKVNDFVAGGHAAARPPWAGGRRR